MPDSIKVPEKCVFCEEFYRCKLVEQRFTDICRKKRKHASVLLDKNTSTSVPFNNMPNSLGMAATRSSSSKKRLSLSLSIGNVHWVKITEKSDDGRGIAKIGDIRIYVHGTRIGDELKVKIVEVSRNFAIAVKADDHSKTSTKTTNYLVNNGPIEPISIGTTVGSELKYRSPWMNSGGKMNRDGSFGGRCKECGARLKWDAKHHCSYCVKCGLEN